MTTKQRAYLKGLAMTMEPIFQIGKNRMTPGAYKSYSGGAGCTRADQGKRLEKLCGRSPCPGGASGRAYPCPGGTGDREKDCAV